MKKIIIVLILILSIALVKVNASDDIQKIDIFLKNAPEQYYLDILFVSENTNTKRDLSNFDNELINKIKDYQDEVYNSSFVKGSKLSLDGNLVKNNVSKERNIHSFTYDIFEKEENYLEASKERINKFKIIVVTKDSINVSDEIVITSFDSKVVYDYEENVFKVQAITVNVFSFAIIISLLILVLDGFILLGLGYRLSSNVKKILILSFIVPLLLSLLVGYSLYFDIYSFALKNLILLTIFDLIVNLVSCTLMYKDKKVYIRLLYGLIITIIFFVLNYLGLLIIK